MHLGSFKGQDLQGGDSEDEPTLATREIQKGPHRPLCSYTNGANKGRQIPNIFSILQQMGFHYLLAHSLSLCMLMLKWNRAA